MSEKAQQSSAGGDLIKWLVVAVLVAGAVYGYSVYFAGESFLYRLIGVLIVAGVAGWVAVQTRKGRAFWGLCLDARSEIRKVVWPTRQETFQTTLIVIVAVAVLGLVLWIVDSLISLLIRLIIG